MYSYGPSSTGISTTTLSLPDLSSRSHSSLTLPPYSLTIIVLHPSSPAPAPQPATATATAAALAIKIIGASGPTAPVAAGSATSLTATVQANAELAGAVVDFEVYNAAGRRVYQSWQSPITLAPNTARTFTSTWQPATNQPSGVYTLKVGVFGSGWAPLYAWNDTSNTFVVGLNTTTATVLTARASPTATASPMNTSAPATPTTPPSAVATVTQAPAPSATARPVRVQISRATASSNLLIAGGTATFSAAVAATAPLSGAIADFQIYSASGALVAQVWQNPITLAPGAAPLAVSAPWSIPPDLAAGTYTLKVGVFDPNWTSLYAWDNGSVTFAITPAITISHSVATVAPTGSTRRVSLSAMVTTLSTSRNVLVDFQVYDSAGLMVTQTWQSPVSLSFQAPPTVSASWSVPPSLAAGPYTLKVGVFDPNWTSLYAWDNGSATFTVT